MRWFHAGHHSSAHRVGETVGCVVPLVGQSSSDAAQLPSLVAGQQFSLSESESGAAKGQFVLSSECDEHIWSWMLKPCSHLGSPGTQALLALISHTKPCCSFREVLCICLSNCLIPLYRGGRTVFRTSQPCFMFCTQGCLTLHSNIRSGWGCFLQASAETFRATRAAQPFASLRSFAEKK